MPSRNARLRVGPFDVRRPGRRGRSRNTARQRYVFLNLPFDDVAGYERCFLAYVAGVVALGLIPRSVLEIPSGGTDRLTRIFRLLRSCRYSIHDLSRVQLRARVPRFNMPFEAGMATVLAFGRPKHDRFVFASRYRLVQDAASDLGGVDVYEHRSRPEEVLSALRNAFVRRRPPVSLGRQQQVYRRLCEWLDEERGRHPRRASLYQPAIFHDLVAAATAIAARQ
jgi:hypothetical protein